MLFVVARGKFQVAYLDLNDDSFAVKTIDSIRLDDVSCFAVHQLHVLFPDSGKPNLGHSADPNHR